MTKKLKGVVIEYVENGKTLYMHQNCSTGIDIKDADKVFLAVKHRPIICAVCLKPIATSKS